MITFHYLKINNLLAYTTVILFFPFKIDCFTEMYRLYPLEVRSDISSLYWLVINDGLYNIFIYVNVFFILQGFQLGTTEASRYWVYWVPAQYVDSIKEAIFGGWSCVVMILVDFFPYNTYYYIHSLKTNYIYMNV